MNNKFKSRIKFENQNIFSSLELRINQFFVFSQVVLFKISGFNIPYSCFVPPLIRGNSCPRCKEIPN